MVREFAALRARRARLASSGPVALVVSLVLGSGLASPARASCGSSTCFLVTGTQEGTGAAGSLRIDLSFRYVDQSRKLAGTKHVSEILAPGVDFEEGVLEPEHHREISTRSTLVQIDFSYGVTDRFTVVSSLPLYVEKDHGIARMISCWEG